MVGINLGRYPAFVQAAWKVILSGFSKDSLAEIRKGAFRTAFPASLLELIKLETDKLSDKQMDELRATVGGDIVQLSRAHRTDYDKAVTVTIEAVGARIRTSLLSPFMSHIRKPLERLELGDENALAMIEEELCELIQEPARNSISELVRKIIADTPVELGTELRPLFQVDAIRPLIIDFFSNLGVGDLFLELYELERNKSILDKQGFYLYFCDIAYEGSKYPIFYIPFHASVKEDRLVVEFDARVYLNKRALEYIVQEEKERSGRHGMLRCTADRIIYLTQQGVQFSQFLSDAIAELGNFFQLDRALDLQNPTLQVAKSTSVRITNACYVALFDNADEALLNDYEQILQLLGAGDDSLIAGAFKGLIDDFIHHNPESVAGEVQEESDAFGAPDRLVYESPVPLNSEQRQILIALQKQRCKYITVEGPPGTGKSHTITAIICNTVLNNQSVLVLSDKKEALRRRRREDYFDAEPRPQRQEVSESDSPPGKHWKHLCTDSLSRGYGGHQNPLSRGKKQHETVQQMIASTCAGLKEDIEAEALSYGDIVLANVKEWAALEIAFNDHPIDFREILAR